MIALPARLSPAAAAGGYRYAPSRRSRMGAALAALAVVALIALVLWRMGLLDAGRSGGGTRLTSVSLQSGETRSPAAPAPIKASRAARSKAEPRAAVRPAAKAAAKPPPQLSTRPAPPFIAMSSADMAAGDISRLPGRSAAAGAGTGASRGSTYGPGEGPGGTSLVNVAWYREPTDAELGPYMPRKLPPSGGWATIACRMIDNYRVEDCQELGESPPGSGLSRALRQAAWQFKVRPPRVDGKPQLGTWVRIRFNWSPHDSGAADE